MSARSSGAILGGLGREVGGRGVSLEFFFVSYPKTMEWVMTALHLKTLLSKHIKEIVHFF